MDDYADISDMKRLNIEKRYDRIFGYELTFKTEYSTYKNKSSLPLMHGIR